MGPGAAEVQRAGEMSQNRSEDSKAFKKVQFAFGGYKLRYAWVSQRGYYPEDLDKANQDAHAEFEDFGKAKGIEDAAFFAVFDGHGKTGDHCAIYARDHIPDAFCNKIAEVRAAREAASPHWCARALLTHSHTLAAFRGAPPRPPRPPPPTSSRRTRPPLST